jgi:UDP-N-acetylmuramoyl-tripeptide--D-alanyl-D-alanine ligase
MEAFNIKECASILKVPYIGPNVSCSSISTDTRSLQEGALFIAIKGDRFDGHNFIKVAQHKKAAAVIGELPSIANLPYLQVENTRIALGLLAQYHRKKFSAPIIALTGSCGKTTTKEYLRNIFSQSSNLLTATKSFNNDIGLPLTLLQLNKDHELVVLELGANAPNEITWLTQLAQPSIAMILNIGPAHLAGFGSIDQVAQAKAEIFQGLSTAGTAIIPLDFIKQWSHYLPTQEIVCFGNESWADVYAKNIRLNKYGNPHFTLVAPQGAIDIALKQFGKHQVDNALAAATAALQTGISLNQIKVGLEKAVIIPGRLSIQVHPQYGTIINDTYNANPKSVHAALTLLSQYPEPRIFAFGSMGELGEASNRYHRQVGAWAYQFCVQRLLTYGSDAKQAGYHFGKGSQHFNDQNSLIRTLKEQLYNGCHTLVKGSRSMQMEKIIFALTNA